MVKIKYQTTKVSIPANTVGTFSQDIDLDSKFSKCVGVALVQTSEEIDVNFAVGLEDSHDVYHHLAHKNLWVCSTSVPVNERFKDIDVNVIAGQKLTLKTNLPVTYPSAIEYEIYFKLINA